MAVSGFVNRSTEISALDSLIPTEHHETAGNLPGSIVISAIGGTPGIGKTALALHWAHRVRSRFSDGDLYVNLHGHGPGPRLETSQALGSLLQALGVAPDRIPLDLDSRSALYRSLLDGKRMLIVIDDALTAEQVRPLLPSSPECLVLVTSRTTLSGLVAREGAHRMTLSMLSTEEALVLFKAVIGGERVDAEPDAARQLVTNCAYLPLAVRILGERLTSLPETPLSEAVADLAADERRLDALDTGEDDEISNVRAVFTASYSALPPETARLFRRLGLHPGGDISTHACAASMGLPAREARPLLERLVRVSLLQQTGPHRYRMHDLLRIYAVERCHADEHAEAPTGVVERYTRWYLATACNAVRADSPAFPVVDATPDGAQPETATDPLEFDNARVARSWFEQERANLAGTVHAALDHRLHNLAWRLPVTLGPLMEVHGHWQESRRLKHSGLSAARAFGHQHGEARTLLSLADTEWLLGNTATAIESYEAAIDVNRDVEDGWVTGFALRQLGSIRWERDGDEARLLLQRSVTTFRRAGERRGEGMALLSLAECDRIAGHLTEALERCAAASAIFTELNDTWTVAWSRCFTGRTLIAKGRHTEAADMYATALQVFQDSNDRSTESIALTGMGDAYAALGDTDAARTHLGAALDILTAIDSPRAADVKASIDRLP